MGIPLPEKTAQHTSSKPTKKNSTSSTKESTLRQWLQKDISLGGNGYGDKKKQKFYESLVLLLEAGMNLKQGLEIIEEEQTRKKDKSLLLEIQTHLLQGDTFSKALEKTHKFTPNETLSIAIGEETGKLTQVLQTLTDFYKRKILQRQLLIQQLTYPVVIMITAVLSIFFMLTFIVPLFENVFKRVGTELPWMTRWVIEASDFLGRYSWLILLLIIMLTVLHRIGKKNTQYQYFISKIQYNIPILGRLIHKNYFARFCQSMQLLLGSNVPLLTALDLSRKMTLYPLLDVALQKVSESVRQGQSLHQAMESHSVFPVRMHSLIKVGEETHQLPYIFGSLNEQFNEEVSHSSKQLSALLEPLIIMVLGGSVGFILISMYLPMFQLSTGIQ